jgi:hypothetical protein
MARLTCFVSFFVSFHRRDSMQERVPIVQIVSPRPTIDVVTQPTNGNADGEEEQPVLVRIASRTRPPPAKSALRKNTSRKRPVIDVDVDVDDEADDRQTKKQKPKHPEGKWTRQLLRRQRHQRRRMRRRTRNPRCRVRSRSLRLNQNRRPNQRRHRPAGNALHRMI